jgi:hypothetical protein
MDEDIIGIVLVNRTLEWSLARLCGLGDMRGPVADVTITISTFIIDSPAGPPRGDTRFKQSNSEYLS